MRLGPILVTPVAGAQGREAGGHGGAYWPCILKRARESASCGTVKLKATPEATELV